MPRSIKSGFPVVVTLLTVSSLLMVAAGCKPRRSSSASLRATADEGAGYVVDQAAAAEAEKVRAACEGKTTLFRGIGAGDRVDFAPSDPIQWNAEVAKTISGGGSAAGSPGSADSWFESARFKDKWTLSAPVHGASVPWECMRAGTAMTTYQLIAALGCGGAGACAPAADLCGQGTCLASITAADFSRAPKLPGEVNPAGGTVIALADQDAPSATAVSCTQEGAGWVLKGEGGAVIGQPVDSAEHCQSLAKTARRKLVCGWSGTAISPFRKSGGPAFGMAGSGAKSIAACAEMVAASSEEVACAWTGQAIALFSLDKPGRAIGGAEQSPDVELCAAKAKTAFQGRVCSWDGKGISIFNAKSGAAEGDLGSFDSYEACGGIVRETATAQKRVEYVALKAKIAVPNNVAIAPPPGQQESSESLNLAGGGWTWGSCNDRDRHYTLVRTSGGKMVCEGKIDTLYSWGPAAKVLWLADQKWSGRLRRDGKNSPVFSTQSSFATFGYGDVAIRFRLRSGVKFKFFDGTDAYSVCDDVNLLEIDDTVAVRFWNTTSYSGVDYILCSLGPVHSWSYGTQRHYDELNREVLWMNANNYMNYELYVKVNGVDTIFPDNLDGHRFTTQHWQSKQGSHVQLLPGRIYYNPEAQSKKESVHFSSDWSNYINP